MDVSDWFSINSGVKYYTVCRRLGNEARPMHYSGTRLYRCIETYEHCQHPFNCLLYTPTINKDSDKVVSHRKLHQICLYG